MAKPARILPLLFCACAWLLAVPALAQDFRVTNASAAEYTVRLDYFNRPFSYRAGSGEEVRVDRHEVSEVRLAPKENLVIRFQGENDGQLASSQVDALGMNLYDRAQTGKPVQLKVDRRSTPPEASSHWSDDFYGRALHVSGTTADLPFVLTIVGDSFR
jgi:hypothetical protein